MNKHEALIYLAQRGVFMGVDNLVKLTRQGLGTNISRGCYEYKEEQLDRYIHAVKHLYNQTQIFEKVGVCRETIRRWTNKGMPVETVFGRRYYDIDKVTAWMVQNNKNKNDNINDNEK